MYEVRASHIAQAHMLAVKTVLEKGEQVITEDGKSTFELDEPLCITVEHPFQRPYVHPANPFTEKMMHEYVDELITPHNKGFEYTYGQRFMEYDASGHLLINQFEWIVDRLDNDARTRRALAITWFPPRDVLSDEPPCLQLVQFTIRNNKLNLVAYFRSNDIALAWGANAFALTALMFKIQDQLEGNVEMGTLTTISNCAHIYDTDEQVARKIAYGTVG